ncbi:MAG: peptidoglycan-binding protein, partial [Myxococcota bacterium]
MQTSHAVQRGDALDRIARTYGTNRETLVELNPWLAERQNYRIFADRDVIRLPGAPPEDDAVVADAAPEAPRAVENPSATRPTVPIPQPRPELRPEGLGRPAEPPETAATPGTPLEETLRVGSEGPMVELLQHQLTARGFPTGIDGDYGGGTKTQVRAFQRAHGLTADGVAGQNTWAVLFQDGPGPLDVTEAGANYVERLRLDPAQANIDDFDALAIAEAEHAQELLTRAGYADIAPSITPELLKAMWFRESHLDPSANEGNGRGLGQITQRGFEGIIAGDYMPPVLRG